MRGFFLPNWPRLGREIKKKLQYLPPLLQTDYEIPLSRILFGKGLHPMCVISFPIPPRPKVQLLGDLTSQSPAIIQGKGYTDASPVETSGSNPSHSMDNKGKNVKEHSLENPKKRSPLPHTLVQAVSVGNNDLYIV